MSEDLFYGTRGNKTPGVKYLIVGEAWGAEEARQKLPFVGWSGQQLSQLLRECNISENTDCLFTNIIPERPHNNNLRQFFYPTQEARKSKRQEYKGLYPHDNIIEGIDRLRLLIQYIAPQYIIALGNYPLWALSNSSYFIRNDKGYRIPSGILKYRGSQLRTSQEMGNRPLLPTIHPASIQRVYAHRYLIKHDLSMRLSMPWRAPDYSFTVSPTYPEVINTLNTLIGKANQGELWISHDHETNNNLIACTGLAWSRYQAICIPFYTTQPHTHYWTEDQELEITLLLRELLTHPNVKLIGQRYWFDAQFSALYWGITRAADYDTTLMHHLCYPGTPLALDHLSSLYCAYHTYWKDDLKELYTKDGERNGWVYNCKDCVVTYEVAEELLELIEKKNLQEQFEFVQIQSRMTLGMMLRGVLISREKRRSVAEELGNTLEAYAARLENLVPEDVLPRNLKASPWYRSPQQTMDLLYNRLGLKPVLSKEENDAGEKRPTADDQALHVLKLREPLLHDIITALQEYRSIKKFSEFATSPLDTDNRMRCEFSPTAETFRWKSSKNVFGSGGNLQNIPKGREKEE